MDVERGSLAVDEWRFFHVDSGWTPREVGTEIAASAAGLPHFDVAYAPADWNTAMSSRAAPDRPSVSYHLTWQQMTRRNRSVPVRSTSCFTADCGENPRPFHPFRPFLLL